MRTFYIAPNRAYVEAHLARRLNQLETFVEDEHPELFQGVAKSTIHFMGFWQRGYKNPNQIETEARLRHIHGAVIINAPWQDSGGKSGGTA